MHLKLSAQISSKQFRSNVFVQKACVLQRTRLKTHTLRSPDSCSEDHASVASTDEASQRFPSTFVIRAVAGQGQLLPHSQDESSPPKGPEGDRMSHSTGVQSSPSLTFVCAQLHCSALGALLVSGCSTQGHGQSVEASRGPSHKADEQWTCQPIF